VFSAAFLQTSGHGPLRYEEQLLKSEFERRGVPVTLYTIKRIQRRNLPLSADTFIAGDMDAMHGAMRQLKIEIPEANDYPDCLRDFMHRRVWKSTLGEVERSVENDMVPAVFAKPSELRKSFTGRVFSSHDDFYVVGNVSRRQEVWCSDVVAWRSEFRVYVIGEEIVGVDHYAGDPAVQLDFAAVRAALSLYRRSGQAPSAYGIDFGTLASGETALVEANDGYALGAYKIEALPYNRPRHAALGRIARADQMIEELRSLPWIQGGVGPLLAGIAAALVFYPLRLSGLAAAFGFFAAVYLTGQLEFEKKLFLLAAAAALLGAVVDLAFRPTRKAGLVLGLGFGIAACWIFISLIGRMPAERIALYAMGLGGPRRRGVAFSMLSYDEPPRAAAAGMGLGSRPAPSRFSAAPRRSPCGASASPQARPDSWSSPSSLPGVSSRARP
jgi:hypothetical protein